MLGRAHWIVIETSARRLAGAFVLVKQQVDHGECWMVWQRLALRLQIPARLLADVAHQAQRHFIRHRQRPDRHPGLARLSLDHRRRHALAEHGNALVRKGAEHPRGEEAATVVDHDWRFLDLQDEVETAGQGGIAGSCTFDDLHQLHLVHRAEEMQADKTLLLGDRRRQAADGQGRGIRGDHRIRQCHPLCCSGDLAFQLAVLEHRFDDQVAALQVGVLLGRGDPRQNRVALLGGHAAAGDFFVQQLDRVILALLRGGQIDVLEDHLDAGRGAGERNTGAHHPCAENTELFGFMDRNAFRPRAAGIDVIELKPEGTDHVFRHLAGGEFGEIAGFDDLRGVEVDLRALHRRAEDFLRRREATLSTGAQDRRRDHEHLRHFRLRRRASGNLIAHPIPALFGVWIGRDPGTGLGQHLLAVAGNVVDQAGLQRLLRVDLLAFEQIRQGFFQTEHAHHAHHSATARQ